MKTMTTIVLALAGTTAMAGEPLPEPDLTYYGSVSVDDVLIETEDPVTKYRVRATLGAFDLDTYRMFADVDAEIGGVPQYVLHIPMEYVPVTAVPSGEAVVVGDTINLHVESCTSDCDGNGLWTTEYTVTQAAGARGTVTPFDLPGTLPCPYDLDGSNAVDFADLLSILAAWGPCASCPQDLDMDGLVGFSDLLAVLAAWGPCP